MTVTHTETQAPSDEHVAAAEANMRAHGIDTHEDVQVDYFGLDEVHRVNLPDGKSWVEHKTMTEGERRKYLNSINRDVVIAKATGDARMSMKAGDERYGLLMVAITGWNIIRNGQPLPFSKGSEGSNLAQFLNSAPPKIIDIIDKDVRKVNAWLIEDMSVADIDTEINTLQELRETKLKEEAGKATS